MNHLHLVIYSLINVQLKLVFWLHILYIFHNLKNVGKKWCLVVQNRAFILGTGVTTYCLHPGVVETNLGRHLEGSCFMRFFHCIMFLTRKKMLDPESGASTTFYCCSEKQLCVQRGIYYSWVQIKLFNLIIYYLIAHLTLWVHSLFSKYDCSYLL